MPVDKAKYPREWPAISKRIRERDGWACKFCGVKANAIGARDKDGRWWDEDAIHNLNHDYGEWIFPDGFPAMVRIVLTVAHLENADPMDCRDENLASLCQRCHLRLDGKLHAARAAETRRQKRLAIQPELLPLT